MFTHFTYFNSMIEKLTSSWSMCELVCKLLILILH
ncbi:Uncharacterised protein [Vibrio cholerae]|nr:Uncharacterised protein [Vibrio cholerae]